MVWKKGKSGNPKGRPLAPVGAGPTWPWRGYLTDEERATLQRCEEVKAEWKRLSGLRATITNRAIHRAKADIARRVRDS